jgi:hypothetical protein
MDIKLQKPTLKNGLIIIMNDYYFDVKKLAAIHIKRKNP